MHPTPYGRSELSFYVDLSRRAFRRLAEVLSAAEVPAFCCCRQGADPPADARTLLEETLRRKCARLESVFPERGAPDPAAERFAPSAGTHLCRITDHWIESVNSLSDDNELDVLRPDGNGQARRIAEIVAEAILDDAVLAGRLAEIRRL